MNDDAKGSDLRKRLGGITLGVIGVAAGTEVWAGWIGMGQMCGFAEANLTGGIFNWKVNICLALPIGVEAYAARAIQGALRPGQTPETKRLRVFAWSSAIGALVLSMIVQASYHIMAAHHDTHATSPVIAFVSMLPVIAFGLGAVLHQLERAAKLAESGVTGREAEDRAEREFQRQLDQEERDRRAVHDLEIAKINAAERQAERDREERQAEAERAERDRLRAERERLRLAQTERLEASKRLGSGQRLIQGQRLGLPAPSRDGSVSDTVSDSPVRLVSSTRATDPAVPHAEMPPEAIGGRWTQARQLMWDLWVHLIKTQGRLASGAELLSYCNGPERSSLGRVQAAKWREIEPAKSLLASERTGS